MQKVTSLSDLQRLSNTTSSSPYTVLKFGSSWCGPCRRIQPDVDRLADEFSHFTWCAVDADTSPELFAHFGVRFMPSFVILQRDEGANSADATASSRILYRFGNDVHGLEEALHRLRS